ncbi:MAG: hypothetical protein RIS47_341 [Bacteroidota bacterium]
MTTAEIVSQKHENLGLFFEGHTTLPYSFRVQQLKLLRAAIKKHEAALLDAFYTDLHKSKFEAYGTEIGIVLEEISDHLKELKKWMSPQKVSDNLLNFKSSNAIIAEPYGRILIITPWNYPFQLLFAPLIGAISAGNTVALKSSPYTPHVSEVMRQIISETFAEDYIAYFEGNRDMNEALLQQKWDLIFFTGSPELGKVVMQHAAVHLTPVILELGGKSPTIVCKDADIRLAARRIAWGKFLNAGQTCLAPDYLLIHKSVKAAFLQYFTEAVKKFYGNDAQLSPDYGRIVNTQTVDKLVALMENAEVYCGGKSDREDRYIEPTVLLLPNADHAVMSVEIFGPILPVLEFDALEEAIRFVRARPKPLALYLFSSNSETCERFMSHTSSGAMCINEVIMHISNSKLPFGGVGESGMGSYHGKFSFEAFSHLKPVLDKSTLLDVPVRYPPYEGKMLIAKGLLH